MKKPKKSRKSLIVKVMFSIILLSQLGLDYKLVREEFEQRSFLQSQLVPAIVYLLQQSSMNDKGM